MWFSRIRREKERIKAFDRIYRIDRMKSKRKVRIA
jgi:hypothetical protein